MNIWVPRTKILEPEFVLPGARVSGRFRITGRLDDGRSRVLAEWQPNLITNYGLNLWGTTSVFDKCSLGASNQAPSVLDTQLVQFVAQHNTTANLSNACTTSTPWYGWYRYDYIFNPPGADRNVAELGMGKGVSGTQLWSRALIKDVNGDPLTLSWRANETLTVTYEAQSYPWTEDVPHTTVIGGATYTGIIRPAQLGSATYTRFPNLRITIYNTVSGTSGNVYSGTIGAATATPSGTVVTAAAVQDSYVNNSLKSTGSVAWGPAVANFAGGVEAAMFHPPGQAFQISFDPAIPKLNTHTLTINVQTGVWGRQ